MTSKSAPLDIGTPTPGNWVQTERKTHEHWADLTRRRPRAGALLHHLVANIGKHNALVVSQTVLAQRMHCSIDTVKRAIRDLAAENYIEVVRIGKGKEAAYVINDRVAWAQSRDQLRLSMFSATVIASADDQEHDTRDATPLRRIPEIRPGELQLPAGDGLPPPSQPIFDGMEPDLPTRSATAENISNALAHLAPSQETIDAIATAVQRLLQEQKP